MYYVYHINLYDTNIFIYTYINIYIYIYKYKHMFKFHLAGHAMEELGDAEGAILCEEP